MDDKIKWAFIECEKFIDECTPEELREYEKSLNREREMLKKIVQVVHIEDYTKKRYNFEMPRDEELKPGDVVLVKAKTGNKIARCVTRGITMNEEILDMVMQGNDVTGKVLGRYDYKEYVYDSVQ